MPAARRFEPRSKAAQDRPIRPWFKKERRPSSSPVSPPHHGRNTRLATRQILAAPPDDDGPLARPSTSIPSRAAAAWGLRASPQAVSDVERRPATVARRWAVRPTPTRSRSISGASVDPPRAAPSRFTFPTLLFVGLQHHEATSLSRPQQQQQAFFQRLRFHCLAELTDVGHRLAVRLDDHRPRR